jgi:glycosyltransferase involved in cell wall biosynthesis
MIGIVIPVHNEELRLEACLDAVISAARHPALCHESVKIVAVLDNCLDQSEQIARSCEVEMLAIVACNVGAARAAGADYLLACGARWLAFTDADTVVAEDWLVAQLAVDADLVCGTVAVEEWSLHGAQARREFEAGYCDRDGHRHIHGANLGVSAQAYALAGGFRPLKVHEDVALVNTLVARGARVAWTAAPRVTTSARRDFKIEGGFGTFLAALRGEADATGNNAGGCLPLASDPAADVS